MDGNRRWARQAGLASPSLGHKAGAEHVEDVLLWCERAGIKHVTVFVCSAENLQRRGDAEIAFLMGVIEDVVCDRLARPETGWRVHIAGTLDVLPDTTARALKETAEATRECQTGAHVTLAVGYGGRQRSARSTSCAHFAATRPRSSAKRQTRTAPEISGLTLRIADEPGTLGVHTWSTHGPPAIQVLPWRPLVHFRAASRAAAQDPCSGRA